jgi:PAS domain S-box-containing protein
LPALDNGFEKKLKALSDQLAGDSRAILQDILNSFDDAESILDCIFASMPAAAILIDHRGRVVRWNERAKAFAEQQGFSGKILSAHANFIEFCSNGDLKEGLRQVLHSGRDSVELVYRTMGSPERRWFRAIISRWKDRDKDGALILQADITERKEMEARLRQKSAILDEVQDAVVVADLEDRIVFFNRAAERLYGWSRRDVLGKTAGGLFYSADKPSPYPRIKELLFENRRWSGDLVQMTKDGREVHVEARWSVGYNDEGEPVRILRAFTDVTAKRRLENQSLRAQRIQTLGTLAGGVAHDLNNILAPILLTVNRSRETQAGMSREDIMLIEKSTERAKHLVRQLLGFFRGYQGERSSHSPADLVEEISQVVSATFDKHILFTKTIEGGLPELRCDATQIHQILLNLCVNSRDAMPNGGSLELSAASLELQTAYPTFLENAKPGNYVVFTVKDTGTGMPTEVLEHIFEPFFTTKEKGRGTGLGLSTCMAIARSHGGYIDVSSQLGIGTTVRLFLPVNGARRASVEIEARSLEQPNIRMGRGETILLVDDEDDLRNVVANMLRTRGYRVIAVSSGAEALIQLQNTREVQAVLVDMIMPRMKGPELIRRIREFGLNMPVIGMGGLGGNSKEGRSIRQELVGFLEKPFSMDHLLGALAKVFTD